MCRFLSLDFDVTLRCPVDKQSHTVRFQAYPQLRRHALDVVDCNAAPHVDQLTCGKACRALLESGEYWQKAYLESAEFTYSH